jgi:hypothetical protein
MDPNCKKGVRDVLKRTIHFLRQLDLEFEQRSVILLGQSKIPSLDEDLEFEQRSVILLGQSKIPSLDETISSMIQVESHIRL